MNQVAILTYDGAAMFELGCAIELFGLPRPEYDSWYNTEVVCLENHPLNLTCGVQLKTKIVSNLDDYDMLIIPSWPSKNSTVQNNVAESITHLFNKGGRLISFCSGAFLLAELGFLNERKATTHWRYEELFKKKYPSISYVDDVLYLYDGQIGCSAGSASAIDLGIEIIRQDYSYKVANQVARRLVISAHRNGGQSQFVETPIIEKANQFSSTLDWVLKNLTTRIDINMLTKNANMSRRTFDRKFRESLNATPKEWLTQQRINRAKQLLEESPYLIEQIANMSGFDNAITFRHNFKKTIGLSPQQYREQFGNRLPDISNE